MSALGFHSGVPQTMGANLDGTVCDYTDPSGADVEIQTHAYGTTRSYRYWTNFGDDEAPDWTAANPTDAAAAACAAAQTWTFEGRSAMCETVNGIPTVITPEGLVGIVFATGPSFYTVNLQIISASDATYAATRTLAASVTQHVPAP